MTITPSIEPFLYTLHNIIYRATNENFFELSAIEVENAMSSSLNYIEST